MAPDGPERQQQVEQCLERVQSTAPAQREALEQGLLLTGEALAAPSRLNDAPSCGSSSASVPGSTNDEQADRRRRWWLAARLRVLQHLERLDTVLAMQNGAWNPAAFTSLRDCTISEAGSALAAAGRLAALPLLLQRHPRALMPAVLDVLSSIPETVDSKQYAPLLRQVLALKQPPALPREPDWFENAEVAAELKQQGEFALLLATEPMCAASGAWHPPTQRQLARWVCQRAQQLDAATGQLSNAVALLEAAQAVLHYSEPSIASLLASAQDLLSLVKLAASLDDDEDSGSSSSSTWRMDLAQYAALGPQQRLLLLLGLLGRGDSLEDELELVVAPFLRRLQSSGSSGGGRDSGSGDGGGWEGSEAVDAQVVLKQALEQEAARRLPWVVRVVQCESRQLAAFSSAASLAKTAGACCYACQATDAWELLGSMLSAAGDALQEDSELSREQWQAAEAGLASVKGHVTAARLLTKHGLTTQISVVRDSDRAAALRLLRTLLARVSRTKNSESRWVELWMDLRSIQEHGFTQLTEEDVRTELCRALLRVGQYRLCKTYLQGLQAEAAEQLVVAAGKEVFLSASSMTDREVKQAKECLSLLPASAAVREQLAGIAAAEQLHQLGLDLPPIRLQQLRAQAASSSGAVVEQLLAEQPQLLSADSRKLLSLLSALGTEPRQQQPLLLKAASSALTARQLQKAENLVLLLASQQYRPAWELAAVMAAEPRCSSSTRHQLLVFALSAAPAEQLLVLLRQWQVTDSSPRSGSNSGNSRCWELFPAADPSSGAGSSLPEQQQWLTGQLQCCFEDLSSSGSSSSNGSFEAASSATETTALACLLALGQRGLHHWEQMLVDCSDVEQQPLGPQQRQRILLLGFSAAALLALTPAALGPAAASAVVAAAQSRLQAPPAELLRLVRQQAGATTPDRQQQKEAQPTSSAASSDEGGSATGSDAAPTLTQVHSGTSSGSSLARPAVMAASAAAAAERFYDMLVSTAAAQQLQQLLPGIDAAGALAAGPAARRSLVLQLADAAGKPAGLREAEAALAARRCAGGPQSPTPSPSPSSRLLREPSGGSPGSSSSLPGVGGAGGSRMQRQPSRKKSEGSEISTAGAAAVAMTGFAAQVGRTRWRGLDAHAAADMLQQALELGDKCGVAAWEVHLSFVRSLLLHNQQQAAAEAAAVTQLLEASLQPLLAGPQQASALLDSLLGGVWPGCSSSCCVQHLGLCLEAMQRCCSVLAAAAGKDSSMSSSEAGRWQHAAAALGVCRMGAEQLAEAAGGIDAKLFLQPIMQLLPTPLPVSHSSSSGSQSTSSPSASAVLSPTARGAGAASAAASAASAQPVGEAALTQQLLLHATSRNIAELAAVIDTLQKQQQRLTSSLAEPAAASGAVVDSSSGYPVSSSSAYLAVYCKTLSQQQQQHLETTYTTPGSSGAAETDEAVHLCNRWVAHMAPADAAAAASFAAGGACPLALPPGSPPLVAIALPERQLLSLLGAALDAVGGAAASAPASAGEAQPSDSVLHLQVRELRRRHALLATRQCCAGACPGASQLQLDISRQAAEFVQHAALKADYSSSSSNGSSSNGSSAGALGTSLQQLLTSGCPAASVLRVAAVLQALQQQPEQAPPLAEQLLARPEAAAAAQGVLLSAAESAVAAALRAMSGTAAAAAAADQASLAATRAGRQQEQQLSAGDAVQNLFALMRSAHHPQLEAQPSTSTSTANAAAAAAVEAAAAAQQALRLLLWQHLQAEAASYDGSGGAAATEAHLQVLELLGTVGSSSMWPGWQPPSLLPSGPAADGALQSKEDAAAAVDVSSGESGGGSSAGGTSFAHQQALLFTRTAAALAVEWPQAVQLCRLTAADFGNVGAAEAALLRLAAAAEEAAQLRLLLRLLQEVLADALPTAGTAGAAEAAAEGAELQPDAQLAYEHTAAEAGAGAVVAPLHRVWSACLRALLPLGDLAGVLAALDGYRAAALERQQQQKKKQQQQPTHSAAATAVAAAGPASPLTIQEAEGLLEAADATQGAAAAAAVALLQPFRQLSWARWQQLLLVCGGAGGSGGTGGSGAADLAAALPGLAEVLLLVVQLQPGLLVHLASGDAQQQRYFKLLVEAGLLQEQQRQAFAAAPAIRPGAGSSSSSSLTLRMAVAASAAAQLVAARQYTAAGWLAMQACGTPRLLRVLDSASRVLQRLLTSCTSSRLPVAALATAGMLAEEAAPIAVPHAAESLLRGLAELSDGALRQLTIDLQL